MQNTSNPSSDCAQGQELPDNKAHSSAIHPNAPGLSAPEPPPIPNASVPIWNLVIEDMRTRDNSGRQKYRTPLQAHNGRDACVDAYQEALDLVVYMRQLIAERKDERSELERIHSRVAELEAENKRLTGRTNSLSEQLADELVDHQRMFSEGKQLRSRVTELEDQSAAVEDALAMAGVWGHVECEAPTFAEAVELLSQRITDLESENKALVEDLGWLEKQIIYVRDSEDKLLFARAPGANSMRSYISETRAAIAVAQAAASEAARG